MSKQVSDEQSIILIARVYARRVTASHWALKARRWRVARRGQTLGPDSAEFCERLCRPRRRWLAHKTEPRILGAYVYPWAVILSRHGSTAPHITLALRSFVTFVTIAKAIRNRLSLYLSSQPVTRVASSVHCSQFLFLPLFLPCTFSFRLFYFLYIFFLISGWNIFFGWKQFELELKLVKRVTRLDLGIRKIIYSMDNSQI